MHGGWRAGGEGIDTSRGIWEGNQGNREPLRLECEPCAQSPTGKQDWNVGGCGDGGAIKNTRVK